MAFNARVSYVAAGGVTDFAFPFTYLDPSFVKATVDGVEVPITLPSAGTARISPAPEAGAEVSVFRRSGTPGQTLVDFRNNRALSGDALNTSYQHALARSEEAVDTAERVVELAVEAAEAAAGEVSRGVPENTSLDTGKVLKATTAGAYAWSVLNTFPTPSASDHAATKGYVDALVAPKADTAALTAGLAAKADTSALTAGLATKLNTSGGNISGGLNVSQQVNADRFGGGPNGAAWLDMYGGNRVCFRWGATLYARIDESAEWGLIRSENQVRTDAADWGGSWSTHIRQGDGSLQVHIPNAYSDARFKSDITDSVVDALAGLRAIPVRSYRWTDEGAAIQRVPDAEREVSIGIIAQEAGAVVPGAARGGPTRLADGTTEERLMLKTDEFTPHFLRAIQQLADKVEALEVRVADLEAAA